MGKIRAAMFVQNTCTNDARVLKEAATLIKHGYDVRIIALASTDFPEGVYCENGICIQRIKAQSIVNRATSWFSKIDPSIIRRTKIENPVRVTGNSELKYIQGSKDSFEEVRSRNGSRPIISKLTAVAGILIRLARRYVVLVVMPFHKKSHSRSYCTKAAKAAVDWQANILHAHDLNTVTAAFRVADINGGRVVYDSHELWRHRNRGNKASLFEKMSDWWLEKKYIKRADAVITVCNSIADWLESEYKIKRPVVLRNLPCRVGAQLSHDVGDVRTLAGLTEQQKIILFIGRLTTARGIELVIRTLTCLDEKFHFVMLGYGHPNFISELTQLADSLGVLNRIHFLNAVPSHAVPFVSRTADLGVSFIEPKTLSYEYALPNKLFECIQAEIPVVGSHLPEIEEVINKWGIGLCCDFSETELYKTISTIVCNRNNYRGKLKTAANQLTWENEERILCDLYDALCVN